MPYDSSNQGAYLISQWVRDFRPRPKDEIMALLQRGFGQEKIRDPLPLNFPIATPQLGPSPVDVPQPGESVRPLVSPATSVVRSVVTTSTPTSSEPTTTPSTGFTTFLSSVPGSGATSGPASSNPSSVPASSGVSSAATTGGGGTVITIPQTSDPNPSSSGGPLSSGISGSSGSSGISSDSGASSGSSGITSEVDCFPCNHPPIVGSPGFGCPPFLGEELLCGTSIVQLCFGVPSEDCPPGCVPLPNCAGCRSYNYLCCYDLGGLIPFVGCCCSSA